MVQTTFRTINPLDFKCYLGGKGNFRYEIYPDYKANRKGKEKPVHLQICRDYLVSRYEAEITDGIEADDALGIDQHALGDMSVISTNDKDMRTIPGHHHNPATGERFFVSPFSALRYFYSQVILGDGADNIPGFDGKLRAKMPQFIEKLCEPLYDMTEELEMYNHVCEVYSDACSWTEDWKTTLHRNASLLYILQKENEFWKPPSEEGME